MKRLLIILIGVAQGFISVHAQKLSVAKTTIDVGKTAYEVPVTATLSCATVDRRAFTLPT